MSDKELNKAKERIAILVKVNETFTEHFNNTDDEHTIFAKEFLKLKFGDEMVDMAKDFYECLDTKEKKEMFGIVLAIATVGGMYLQAKSENKQ